MTQSELRQRLRRGQSPAVAVFTYAVTLLAWLALFLHDPIEDAAVAHEVLGTHHVAPLRASDPGVMEAVALADGPFGVLHYLAMWGLMMVAMMYPSSAGVFQWYADVRARLQPVDAVRGVATFVAVYTLVWVAVGLVPLAVNAVVPLAALASTWGPLYFGVALLGVAAFQLSPLKHHYLHRCRSPSGFLVDSYRPDLPGPVRLGWAFCRVDIGACGVLMGLMVVVGSMHLGWMALITGVLSLERLTQDGDQWARRGGIVAGVVGVGLLAVWVG